MKRGTDDEGLDVRPGRAGSLLDEDDPMKGVRPATFSRRGPRRWPRVLLAIAVVLLLIVGLLPRLLSTGPVRRWALAKANAKLAPATLSVEDWSLRWFGSMSVSGVRFIDAAKGADVQVVRVSTSGGLLRMLPLGRTDLGTITVDAPQATLRLRKRPASGKTDASADTPPAAAKGAPVLPVGDLAVKLVVTGGRIEILSSGPKPFRLENIGLAADIKSVREPVGVSFAAFVPWAEDAGRISVEGALPSPACLLSGAAPASPESLVFALNALDLQGFRALLETVTGQPWVRSGVADGKVTVRYRGNQSVQVQADLAVVKLSIEPPGKPVSPPGDVHMQADLDYRDGMLKVDKLSCQSPWVKLDASGQLLVKPAANAPRTGGIEAQMDADLAAITRDFGALLNLREDLRVEKGTLHAKAVWAGTAEALEANLTLTTADLSLRLGREIFAFQPAPAFRLNMIQPYGRLPEVRDLLLELPFARIAGKGRLDNANFQASVDLTALSKELRRVLATCPAMGGTIQATFTSRQDGERVAIDGTVTASNLAAELQPGRRIAIDRGTLNASGSIPLVDGRPQPDLSSAKFSFVSEAGTIAGTAERIVPATSNRPPVVQGGRFTADLKLDAARRIAAPFLNALPPTAVVNGRLTANASAEVAGGQAKIRVNTVLQDLQLTTTAWDIRENDLRLKLSADTDTVRGMTRVFDTHLISQVATMDVSDWQMQLPRGGEPLSMRGGVTGEVNIAVLSGWQRAGKDGKAPPKMSGALSFLAQGAQTRDGMTISLRAALDRFLLATAGNTPFGEPHAELVAKATLSGDASRLSLEELSLHTSLGNLESKGRIDSPSAACVSDLSGTLAVDFGAVSSLLRAQGMKDIKLTGRQAKPFSIGGPLGNGPQGILSYGKAAAALFVESVAAFGLTAGPSDLDLRLANGVMRLDYAPALSQGKLSLQPSIEVTRTPMLFSLPAQAPVLKNVQLTQELLDQALVYLLPLLRGNSVLGGTVDLTMKECHVPLGPTLTNDMTFSTVLTLRNVRLAPGGVVGTLLGVGGMNGQEITLQQYELTAECKKGRVWPSDLVLRVGGNKVTLSGSVGLDGTLAYTAVVPLSKGLVGKEAARYLDGVTVTVPITGTIKSPAVDYKTLDSEKMRLLRDAGKKAAGAALGNLLNNLK